MQEIREQLVEYGRRAYEKNYVVARDGNISIRVGDSVFITPTNASKGFMNANEICELVINGEILSGFPSSEYHLHLEIYKANPKIKSIVHTHPPTATLFACLGEELKSDILAEAAYQLGDVPVAPFFPPASKELAKCANNYCKKFNALLLKKHGLVTWGEDIQQAYFRTEIAEFLANITYMMRSIDK